MRSPSKLLLVGTLVASGLGCLGGAGCVGGPSESASGSVSNFAGRAALNGNPELVGVFTSTEPDAPIRQVRMLPCWMDVTFGDGTVRAGNYAAIAGQLEGSNGVLQHFASAPTDSSPTPTPDLWFIGQHGFIDPWADLVFQSVETPVAFGTRTSLQRTADLQPSPDQLWCLSGPVQGLGRGPDGQDVLAPVNHRFDNESLIGMWEGEGRIRNVRIGPCWMEVDNDENGEARGSYMSFTASRPGGWSFSGRTTENIGIIDMDIGELISPYFTHPSPTSDPEWGMLYAIFRTSAEQMDVLSFGVPDIQTLTRRGTWIGHEGRACFPH